MQALEGDIDTTHSGFLHSQLERGASAVNTWRREHPPRMEVVPTPAGVMYGGRYGEIEPDDPDGNATTYWPHQSVHVPVSTRCSQRGPTGWYRAIYGSRWTTATRWSTRWGGTPCAPWRARATGARGRASSLGEYLPQTSGGPRPMASEGEPEQRLHAGQSAPAELELQRHPDGPTAGPGDDGSRWVPCSTARRSTWAPPTR